MPLNLHWTGATRLPTEAGTIRPDTLAGLTSAEVRRLRIPVGNGSAEVGELFEVEGDGNDLSVLVEGDDLRGLAALGAGMTSGRLEIRGDVGARLGAEMSGGSLILLGSAGAWAGAELSGGLIRIEGDAGDFLGAALPGSRVGMCGGIALVGGSIGADAGLAIRRGLIAVAGAAGPGFGRGAIAGSLFAFGPVAPGMGVGMKRGTIALFAQPDPADAHVPASFAPAGRDRPPFLGVYLRHLVDLGFPPAAEVLVAEVDRYNGDLAERGRGEILIRA